MQQFKLANILLENAPQFINAPMLCCRSTSLLVEDASQGAWILKGPGSYDFSTYFNALSTLKWRTYTVATEFHVHLELRGSACAVTQTRADSFCWSPDVLDDTRVEVAASDEWQSVDLELVLRNTDVLDAFLIETTGETLIRNSYYYTVVDEGSVRDVELALATTTFKKESYILKNIELVKRHILASDEPIAHHFHMHVADNGRTLDVAALECDGISIHPNPNAGGAGGFARGMIEAMEQTPKATHVLLMDDDVSLSPESVIRTFNLLSLLNEEWADGVVSGAMLHEDEPDYFWEDTGYLTFRGFPLTLKGHRHVSQLNDIVTNEVACGQPEIPAFADQSQLFAAWWYCVVPMKTIEANGMPLPVFVRYDDAEYGLRIKAKFMTMNGLCIWHRAFDLRYSEAVERYQTTRNAFVAQATCGMAPKSDFMVEFDHNVKLELKKFNYTSVELALEGFEDFLRGPAFLEEPGKAEQRFMDANHNAEKLIPFKELRPQVNALGVDFDSLTSVEVTTDIPRSRQERMRDVVSFNGQRVFHTKSEGNVGVIDFLGFAYPGGRIRGKDTLVAIEMKTRRGVIRHIDQKRFNELWERYRKDVKYFKSNKDRIYKEYADQRPTMTSVAFWKHYLGIDK